MANDLLRGRQTVLSLANKSGGSVAAGDVVIMDTSNDEAFTTTTTGAYAAGNIGVAIETIASNAVGRIASWGYVPIINLNASATRGYFVKTHTVAKQGTGSSTAVAGVFAQVLKTSATPSAWLFGGLPFQGAGGGGGAPTTTPYVTTASDAGLSAEVAIGGFAGHADRNGILGGGSTAAGASQEFDSSSNPFTWSPSSPAAEDYNTTLLSCAYIKTTDTTERIGVYSYAPAGAFSAYAKVFLGCENATSTHVPQVGLVITDSGNTNRVLVQVQNAWVGGAPIFALLAYTYTGGVYTQRGINWPIYATEIYVGITRDGSNNVSFYFSSNGLLWQLIATQAFTFTAAKIGLRVTNTNADTTYYGCDWIRTT